MKVTYANYLSILRSFVHSEKLTVSEEFELNNILHLSAINSTEGIAAYALMQSGGFSSDVMQVLRRKCLGEMSVYSKRAEQLKMLVSELDRSGIDCILFKGIIVREYYPVPELRTFGDVDMVVRKADREKCHELMLSLGYEPKVTWEPVYSYVKGTEYYEIHTDVMEIDVSDKADYREYYSHIWQHVKKCETVAGEHIYEFTPEFHFLYMLTHIAKHISGAGAGIRMYLDAAMFIKRFGNTADWQWIQAELKKLCFEDFANMVFTAVENWFGVESPVMVRAVSKEILDDFLEFTLEGGLYGKVGRDESIVFLKQQENVSKLKTLMFHAFPPAQSMENRYTYLQKHRWLLPAAWVHRLIISRKEWGRFAENTKNIVSADPQEALKLRRIYKEIGL